jgi:hypothetical protein
MPEFLNQEAYRTRWGRHTEGNNSQENRPERVADDSEPTFVHSLTLLQSTLKSVTSVRAESRADLTRPAVGSGPI